jgi:tripartite-type tricarboxylate transporter receptor subunit TctC
VRLGSPKATPDGYTLLLSGSPVLAIIPNLYKRPLYNALTDFEQVALFSESARVLIVRKDLPANSLPEFIAYTNITHVPYRGGRPSVLQSAQL